MNSVLGATRLAADAALKTMTVAMLTLDRDDWLALDAQLRGHESHRAAEGI